MGWATCPGNSKYDIGGSNWKRDWLSIFPGDTDVPFAGMEFVISTSPNRSGYPYLRVDNNGGNHLA
jgi:hypothetical protein